MRSLEKGGLGERLVKSIILVKFRVAENNSRCIWYVYTV